MLDLLHLLVILHLGNGVDGLGPFLSLGVHGGNVAAFALGRVLLEAGDLHSGLLLDLLSVLVVCTVEVKLAQACWERLFAVARQIVHDLLLILGFLRGGCLLIGGASGLGSLDELGDLVFLVIENFIHLLSLQIDPGSALSEDLGSTLDHLLDRLAVSLLFDHLGSLVSLKTFADARSLLAHVVPFKMTLASLTASGVNSGMRTGRIVKAFILNHFHESGLGCVQRARILLSAWMGAFNLIAVMDLASSHNGWWIDGSLFLLLSQSLVDDSFARNLLGSVLLHATVALVIRVEVDAIADLDVVLSGGRISRVVTTVGELSDGFLASLSSTSCSSQEAVGNVLAAWLLCRNYLWVLGLNLSLLRCSLLSIDGLGSIFDAQDGSLLIFLVQVGLSLLSLNLFVNEGADVCLGLSTDIAIFVLLSISSSLVGGK